MFLLEIIIPVKQMFILAYYQWETNLHNMRTLQQYEIGSKDINKASGKTINSLALALHCNVYDVMELVLP